MSLREPHSINPWASLVRVLSYTPVKGDDIETTTEFASSLSDDIDIDIAASPDSDISFEYDDLMTLRAQPVATIRTKMREIDEQTKHRKKKIKNNKSLRDWWVWYWQAPKARFPFLYFLVVLLSCAPFSVYWFMDNDSSFILCGILGLSMCIYAAYKFTISINLKKEVDKYRQLNVRFKRDNLRLGREIQRVIHADKVLRNTKARLSRANDKNRKNLKQFEAVESNMQLIGKKAGAELGDVNRITKEIRHKWREELLDNEREMLHAVYSRFEKIHTNKSRMGLTKDDFKKFESMLPARYGQRFDRLGTFHAFAGDREQISQNDFVNTLDTFAVMETDETDIDFILTPSVSVHPSVSSFRFTTSIDLFADMPDSPTLREEQTTPKKKRKKVKQVRFRK